MIQKKIFSASLNKAKISCSNRAVIVLSLQATLQISLLFFLLAACTDSNVLSTPVEEEIEVPASPSETKSARIAFYNVENLFDTIDDPQNSGDDEFLPKSPKSWTLERYQHKLTNIGRAIAGMEFPIIMGLGEVENEKVVADLVQTSLFAKHPYKYIHKDSPDHRGIDVALIYQPEFFQVLEWEAIQVNIPDSAIEDYSTRDILMVKGNVNAEMLHIFVTHWPSRSGSTEQSEFRRIYVAGVLKEAINKVQAANPDAKIVIMGDFNDEPTNRSIEEVLNAQTKTQQISNNALYNCASILDAQGEGSYNYQGNWQMIDQIISTGNLLDATGMVYITNFQVFKDDMLLFNHPENGLTPDRTYGGDQYYGGFSDHLPVFVELMEN